MLNSSNIYIADPTKLWSILSEDHLEEKLTRTIPQ